jgi:hypothetical protein
VAEPGGERLFAKYAYAPNQLGYCGPADSAALFELAATGHTDADVRAIAARFSGAWPYLTVLAELAGIEDPLDERLVRAYWTGSALLDGINRQQFGRRLIKRIAAAGAGQYWAHLNAGLLTEAAPTHGFHVFGVYPWSRLLTSPAPEPALHVLDSCRIRWGRVQAVDGDHAVVRGRRLTWDGLALRLGEETEDQVRLTDGGRGFVDGVRAGDWLAVHWDRACDRLTADELWQLRHWTDWQLVVTNIRLGQPGEADRTRTGTARTGTAR